ncbi:MAG: HlyD family efflux transporter periplasmic adaptor subunit [Planctomycetes bacterium]|nr:HlyD family efflux transporter periplasmic adaptor subunit [Planctomycetota bacterium]
MAGAAHIRTPWSQRWRRIRTQVLPGLLFAGTASLTVWLWSGHAGLPNVVGEVQAVRINTASQMDGVLTPLPGRQLEPFDVVMAGEVIAKLDDRPALASLATLRTDLFRIEHELAAAEARVRQMQADRQHDHMDEARRLAVDSERLRLDILDRKTQLETDRIELRRLDEEYQAMRRAHGRGAETQFRLVTMQLQRDEVEQRIDANRQALAEAEAQMADAAERIKAQPTPPPAYLEAFLEPIRSEISTQEARIRELEIHVESLEIRSPIRGTISAVYFRPGQAVRAGDPILSIADEHGRDIVAYLRQHRRLEPTVGMAVDVAVRSTDRKMVRTWVNHVGAQIEPVPLHQLRNPNVLEWGLPVRIAMPTGLTLRPGELVDLTFRGL